MREGGREGGGSEGGREGGREGAMAIYMQQVRVPSNIDTAASHMAKVFVKGTISFSLCIQ